MIIVVSPLRLDFHIDRFSLKSSATTRFYFGSQLKVVSFIDMAQISLIYYSLIFYSNVSKRCFCFLFTGTPINRLPIMAKSVLDLYELYNLVIARGGLVDVINKKLWQEIIKGLHLPSSITSAAFTLRTQ